MEGQEKFLKMEEERDIANKLAHDCQQKVSSLSASLHQISSLMMEEKNRNDTLKKTNRDLEDKNEVSIFIYFYNSEFISLFLGYVYRT